MESGFVAPGVEPRVVKAGNRGPFTLDGTRTFLVGRETAAIIDPGPDVDEHVRALSHALSGSLDRKILLTHHHGDHAGASGALSEALGAPVYGPPSAGHRPLEPGDRVASDEGELVVVPTPGHTRDHLAFLWPRARALFAGDLLLGKGATTWLGEYPGCVADYLESLDRVEKLGLKVIYPAHGPPLRDPATTLSSFRNHRLERLRQLREAVTAAPESGIDDLIRSVYGAPLPSSLLKAARSSVEVMLHHLGIDLPR